MKLKGFRHLIALPVFIALLSAALIASGAFIHYKKDEFKSRFKSYLAQTLEDNYGLSVTLKGVQGDFFGNIILNDVVLSVPSESMAVLPPVWDHQGDSVVLFSADEVQFRYTFLDFFRENFTGWFDIMLTRPVFYANVPFHPSASEVKGAEVLATFMRRVGRNARLIIKDGSVKWLGKEGALSDIEGMIENKSFDFKVSLNHMRLNGWDMTSTFLFEGSVEPDPLGPLGKLKGSWTTEGTVINFKPMPKESKLHFEITGDRFFILDSVVFGGIHMQGWLGHTSRDDMEVTFSATRYPLRIVYDVLSSSDEPSLGGILDGELKLTGSLYHPQIDGQLLIQNEESQAERFKVMQLNFHGIYPEVRLSESRMFTRDGAVMRFSDSEVHVMELFNVSTYESLIAQRDQTTVAWGDWTLKREVEEDTVALRRGLSRELTVSYERSEAQDETKIDSAQEDNEFQLEYLLGNKNSLQMEWGENESFFGLQRKSEF